MNKRNELLARIIELGNLADKAKEDMRGQTMSAEVQIEFDEKLDLLFNDLRKLDEENAKANTKD